MKKTGISPAGGLMFLFVVLFSFRAFSQDDIILNNNDVIRGKVEEVGLTTIRYHRANNMDGPIYDLAKSDVYMIVYANGNSDVITPRTGNAPEQGDNTPAPEQPITQAPPPMPVYEQPYCPGEGYLWNPGYWAWGYAGYYWVPGLWVLPPQYGLLWTPGYWGFGGGYFGWHHGYWAREVGYYGGVYYGYGYEGHGYYGGRWEGEHFRYNTAVTRVDVTVVHTTYIDNTVVHNNIIVNHASYNGTGGVTAAPTPEEQKVMVAPHIAPTPVQQEHVTVAKTDKSQYATVNGGKPAVAAMSKPNGPAFSPEGKPATLTPNTHPAAIATPNKTQPATIQHSEPAKEQPGAIQHAEPAKEQPGARPANTLPVEPSQMKPAEHLQPGPAQHTTGSNTQQHSQPAAQPQNNRPANTKPMRSKPANNRPAPAPKPAAVKPEKANK